jgi:hypothetical protein
MDELGRVTKPWKRASRGLFPGYESVLALDTLFGLISQYQEPLVIGLALVMNLSDVGNFVGYMIWCSGDVGALVSLLKAELAPKVFLKAKLSYS